jgi:hypothetical protein
LLSEGTWADALTDIVSNLLGGMVILTACVGLVAAVRSSPLSPAGSASARREAAMTVTVTWPKATTKNAVFASAEDGRFQVLDLTPMYTLLLKDPYPRRLKPVDVDEPGAAIRFYPITNDAYCFRFQPRSGAGEPLGLVRSPGSAWQQARKRFPGNRFTFFFWVTPDSFDAFREVREDLRQDGVDVDWKPVAPGTPLEICQGVDGSSGLEPQ